MTTTALTEPPALRGPLGFADVRSGYASGLLVTDVVEFLRPRWDASAPGVWIARAPIGDVLRRARELDDLGPAARSRLPLFGLPFAVKDNIDVAGLPTTAACPDFSYLPDETAPVVARLLAAGALLIGKTNLDQFATGLVGTRSPYGSPGSVFGGGLISGGSSSGSAVAVASGQVAFALGTDTAGSGRVPAAMNGIVGLKPTRGLLSTRGVLPACASLDCVSIFAESVADAVEILDATVGPDRRDPWSRCQPTAGRPSRRLRLGVPDLGVDDMFGDAPMLEAFRRAAAALLAPDVPADAQPVDIAPLLEAGALLYTGPWIAERLSGLEDFVAAHPDALLPVTRSILEQGHRPTGVDTFRALHRLQELRTQLDTTWERVDAILLPTVGTTFTQADVQADPLGCNSKLGRYTQFANLLDCAVLTVPVGVTSDGRPASMSLVGPVFSDALLAELATGAPHVLPPAHDRSGTATVPLAVVGLHLSGEVRNFQLVDRGAVLRETTTTAPEYRLYRLPTDPALPGLVRVDVDGEPVEVEVWDMPVAALGSFLAGVAAPLAIGRVRLADGRAVLGFLCESVAVRTADDITASGGWRAATAVHPALLHETIGSPS